MIKILQFEKHYTVAIIGWCAKIISIVFALINTRILLDIIGIEGFALYAVLSSLIGWIALFNFGIPSAIQNIIAKYRIKDISRDALNGNLIYLVLLIAIGSIPFLYILSFIISHFLLKEYTSLIDVTSVFLIIYLFLLLGLAQIFYKVLFGEHKGIYPNIYPAFISIFGTFILFTLQYFKVSDISLILILFFSTYLVIFFISLYQSVYFIKPVFDKKLSIELFHSSKHFFIFSFLASCTLGFDYIIMSRILSTLEITQYNLIMKFYNLIIVLYATLLATTWSISSEAFHNKDKNSIFNLMKKNIFIGFGLTIIISGIVILFKDYLFYLLSGKEEIKMLYSTLFFATLYTLIRVWTDTFASILASIGFVKSMIYILPFQALISILAQYVLATYFNLNGIFLGLILSFLLTVSLLLPIILRKKLQRI